MAKKGSIPWNKGIKGEYHIWDGKKHPMIGKESPFKGKTHSEEVKLKTSERMMGNKFALGYKHTQETKNKISKMQSGSSHSGWKGGRVKTSSGYIKIHSPNHPRKDNSCYVLEHRLVMEDKLGRYLNKEEIIHHENEVRDDNRIENLRLFKNKGEHKRFHLKERRDELSRLRAENKKLKKELRSVNGLGR